METAWERAPGEVEKAITSTSEGAVQEVRYRENVGRDDEELTDVLVLVRKDIDLKNLEWKWMNAIIESARSEFERIYPTRSAVIYFGKHV